MSLVENVDQVFLLKKPGVLSMDGVSEFLVTYPVYRLDVEVNNLKKTFDAASHPSQLGCFLRHIFFDLTAWRKK